MGRYSAARDLDLEIKTRWYVVANRSSAVLYEDNNTAKFRFLNRLSNSKGSLFNVDLTSDKPGKTISSAAGGTIHHSLERRATQHDEVAKKFAKKIAANLETAYREKRFKDLVLVAEPHFLGLLREALNTPVLEAITHEIPKEYARGSDHQLRQLILNAIEREK